MTHWVPGMASEVELHINGLIDLPVIFQKAAYSHLFDTPPSLGAWLGWVAMGCKSHQLP